MSAAIARCNKRVVLIISLLVGFTFLSSPTLFGQTSARLDSLRNARARLKRELLTLNAARDSTASEKEATLAEIQLVTQKITLRQELLRTMQREIRQLKTEIEATQAEITRLENEMQAIRDEFGKLTVVVYKAMRSKTGSFYLLSAKNVSQGYKRMQYFEAIRKMQATQMEQLKEMKIRLDEKRLALEQRKVEKEALALNERREAAKLNALRDEQKRLLAKLKADEEAYAAKIKQTEANMAALNKAISKEIERITAKPGRINLKLSKNFAGNKGRLPWPMPKSVGTVIRHFGKNRIPDTNTQIDLQGIDIATREDQPVRAIFEGTIAQVMPVPGQGQIVIVQHGEYYSVYANLDNVIVKTGDTVDMLQTIGQARTDPAGISKVHFQLYKGRKAEDPEKWLIRK